MMLWWCERLGLLGCDFNSVVLCVRKRFTGGVEEQSAHVSAVISELKAIDADIVLLQEIREPG